MENKELASLFNEMAGLMELHNENEFRIRTYANAYLNLRKLDIELSGKTLPELMEIQGVGKTIGEKILEINTKGTFDSLEQLRAKTPDGVREMMKIKGIGPKKLKMIWKEMEIETPGELLYACKENRLIQYKGFGVKIQEDIVKSLEYYQANQHSFLGPTALEEAFSMEKIIKSMNPQLDIRLVGELSRGMSTVDEINWLVNQDIQNFPNELFIVSRNSHEINGIWSGSLPVKIIINGGPIDAYALISHTGGSSAFHTYLELDKNHLNITDEREYFRSVNKNYIPPECRDLDDYHFFKEEELINVQDIKGVIHNHSTYSDGLYSILEMAKECIRLGYSYLVISDHSKSAGYANGLSMERVEMQWREIDQLNIQLAPFKIYKSIESDILSDGSLDYDDEILKGFDLVIASIHSNLKMNEEKAMLRLLRAIENPYTRILGHPTGRLLLSRPGYPINYHKIIEACISNGVVIELNANPMRLDLDWRWISYAQEKGALISINPDAHNLKGIRDIGYGVQAARKGGLKKINCLNFKDIAEFDRWILAKPQN
ncbi:MAG: DNA polymerase/3'-5' exonuclease PolX [Saprospiraceae bacterium]|mgnify:CR=1 FL=1|nr:DNA polymerase/3'-5' exonuclease PolX [Candidatus Vicinibacter affinis]MBP6172802.1 DNA polymerase/3'-5' exonuclease PolX [Saprospiraceae bacterium]MBK7798719.1 DNA polymerase/3'-5' exonuclease PolX [Candidatus Vicinibacter affinis]MBK9640710.1 DNA polymerase/3'-5' exonuclease PolX [Candidatus Vicinibacter affinis]MBP6521664.1 DNA polymerase/3'-5' exonuclease PolX [Saprospiraceae bacterium]